MAAAFNKQLKKGERATFELNDEEQKTVDKPKEKLTTPPVLVLPRFESQFIIEADECDKQAGCVLLQEQ